jgi:hypothetical protein
MWQPRRITTLWASTACYRDRLRPMSVYLTSSRNPLVLLPLAPAVIRDADRVPSSRWLPRPVSFCPDLVTKLPKIRDSNPFSVQCVIRRAINNTRITICQRTSRCAIIWRLQSLSEDSYGVRNFGSNFSGTFDTQRTEIGSASGISCNAVLRTLLPPSPHDGKGSSFRNPVRIPQTTKLIQHKKVKLPLFLID